MSVREFQRAGLSTAERERLKELERENCELRRANEILRTASAYFAQAELDRRRGPWRHLEAVELATLEWVEWFNHRWLVKLIGA